MGAALRSVCATTDDRVCPHVVSTHIGSKFFRPWESVSLGGLALIFVITVEGGVLKRGRRKGKGKRTFAAQDDGVAIVVMKNID